MEEKNVNKNDSDLKGGLLVIGAVFITGCVLGRLSANKEIAQSYKNGVMDVILLINEHVTKSEK